MKLFALENKYPEKIDDNDLEVKLLHDDRELEEAIDQIEQAKVAVEELNLLTQSLLDKKVSLEYAVMQVDHIYSRIGLTSIKPTIAIEDINSLPYDVALEGIIDNIKAGLSRITNGFVNIADIVTNKIALGVRNLKAAIGGIESSISKAVGMVDSLPDRTDRIFTIKSKISYELQTKSGVTLDFKTTQEILKNHIDILENFNKHKEIISILEEYDLDEYRKLLDKVLKGNFTEQEKKALDEEQKHYVEELNKIYNIYRNFSGRLLARGKTLYVQFDKDAARKFTFYKDVFQFNVVPLVGAEPPREAKQLTQKEAKELVSHLWNLKELYLKTEDLIANMTFIRQKAAKEYTIGAVVADNVLKALPPSALRLIPFVFNIIYGILFYYHSIIIVVKFLGISTSSLCYNAIKGTSRYIEKSAKS